MTHPTDFHALVLKMADELDHYRQLLTDDHSERHALATEVRAALLQQHPEPVPVSERLPDPRPKSEGGDCNAEGRCWWFCVECPGEYAYWIFGKEVYCDPSHWLPAHALPLPKVTP